MIKIVFIAVGDRFGSGRALINIIRGLSVKDNFEISVVYANKLGLDKELSDLNISTYYIPMRFDIYPPLNNIMDKILFIPRFLRDKLINIIAKYRLERLFDILHPDIVHTNVGVYRTPAILCKRMNIPHVWHIREYQTKDMGYRPIGGRKGIIKNIKKTRSYPIFITKGLADYLGYGYNSVVYDGIAKPDKTIGEKHFQNYFLFVGNITRHKGCTDLINAYIAFVEKTQSKTILIIAGDYNNEYACGLMKLVEKSNMSNQILFIGFSSNVNQLMREAKALIVPSVFECFGLITAEAMYNGCLVIGRNTGGTKEQMDNAKNLCGKDIAIRFSNNEELVNALTYVDNGDVCMDDIKKYSIYTVETLYSIKQNIEHIYNIYKKLNK